MQKETNSGKNENIQSLHEYPLIEGVFTADDATTVLLALINSKINFHQLESFGLQIRSGNASAHSEQRVKALMQMKEDIRQLIQEARENGQVLSIQSDIRITAVTDNGNVNTSN